MTSALKRNPHAGGDWPRVSLGELTQPIKTRDPRRSSDTGRFRYIDLSSLDKDTKQIANATDVPNREAPSRARQILEPLDVLVSTVRPNLNGVAIVPSAMAGSLGSTGFSVLRPRADVLSPHYLFQIVKTAAFVEYLVKHSAGANYPAVTDKVVRSYEVHLPPLEEQKRVAAILDKADAIRRKRIQALAHADTFLRSVFLEIFGALDENGGTKSWPVATLGDLIERDPQNGLYRPSNDYGTGTPILRIDGFYDGYLHLPSNMKRLAIDAQTIDRYRLNEQDIVINRVNSREFIGKSVLIEKLIETTVFESNMMRFSVNCCRAGPRFVVDQLRDPFLRRQILKRTKDSVNQSSINQEDVLSLIVAVPPLDDQRTYEGIVATMNISRARQMAAARHSETLIGAISQDLLQ